MTTHFASENFTGLFTNVPSVLRALRRPGEARTEPLLLSDHFLILVLAKMPPPDAFTDINPPHQ